MKKYLPVLAILLLPSLAFPLTLAQVRTQIRIAIRDNPPASSLYKYTDSILLDFINEAQRDIVNQTWLAEQVTSYVLTAGTSYYNLPVSLLDINQVYFKDSGGQTLEIEAISQKALYGQMSDWQQQAGQPTQYFISQATNPMATSASTRRISYIPIPTRTSTGTIDMYYSFQVDDLANDSDLPFNGLRHLRGYDIALAYHVISRIKEIQGFVAQAESYEKRYQRAVAIMIDRLGREGNYTPGMSGGKR